MNDHGTPTVTWTRDGKGNPALDLTLPIVVLNEIRLIGHLAHVAVVSQDKVLNSETAELLDLSDQKIIELVEWAILDAGLDSAFYWSESYAASQCTEEWLDEIERWAARQVGRMLAKMQASK